MEEGTEEGTEGVYDFIDDREADTSMDNNPCYNASPNVQVSVPESATSYQKNSKLKKRWLCIIICVLVVSAAFATLTIITFWNISRVSHLQNSLSELQTNISSSSLPQVNYIQLLNGRISIYPAASCSRVLLLNPSSPSGHYWIYRSSDGSAVRVYCDMTRLCGGVTGGWMRVANLDWSSNESLPCPVGFREHNDSNIRTCGIGSTSTGSCPSIIFETYSTVYSRVCGKINAYQVGSPDAFRNRMNIDTNYVDGISLTHGSNPRRHIWTFVAAFNDDDQEHYLPSQCQCARPGNSRVMAPPSFVGVDYFCDSGSRSGAFDGRFFPDDPLWDGAGCASTSMCCSFNNPPWFHKQLTSATADDIEMRVCRDESRQNEDIAVSSVEIYVQ